MKIEKQINFSITVNREELELLTEGVEYLVKDYKQENIKSLLIEAQVALQVLNEAIKNA